MSYVPVEECRAFARELVTTGELDPLYTMAYRARLVKGSNWVRRFCMYFLMFCDAEGAAKAANLGGDFWSYVWDNLHDLKRGSERRYYRGQAAIASFDSLVSLGSPEEAFMLPSKATTLMEVRLVLDAAHVAGFGDYFTIKWADLLENVFQQGIDYRHLPSMLPKPPMKCLEQLWPHRDHFSGLEEVASWVSDMDDPFSGYRKCGLSEAETIACAIPSYLIKKKYKMGDDIRKYHYQLRGYPELQGLLP